MSDRDDKLNKGELIDIKSLIGNADGGDFSLDDILAEYGHPPQKAPAESEEAPGGQEERFNPIDLSAIPRPQTVPRPKAAARSGGNVVSFPGGRAVRPPEEPGELPPAPEDLEEPEELPLAEEARITPFPRKRNRLLSADSFAFTVAGARPESSSSFFHCPPSSLVTGRRAVHARNARMSRRYFSTVAGARSSPMRCWA